jgi:hypothetical protein
MKARSAGIVARAARRAGFRALLFVTLAVPLAAQDSGYLNVALDRNQTIRQVAEKYLDDPNLWPEILQASGLASITALKPGVTLRIPATEISTANKALVDALSQIQTANLAGAQLFAPLNIGKAIALHDEALIRRTQRDWKSTRGLATESYAEATVALEKSQSLRDQAAEALLSDRQGNVEGLRPQDLAWRNLRLQSILIEEEKVRTLSDSTAQITFRDASRLRLSANSNAVIQRMRYDPLKRSEEAKVSLIEGDFYALLADKTTRTSFNVEIPRVNANIDSGSFWVSHDGGEAKFTNYDDGPVQVTAQGKTVTLGRNEGTIVRTGTEPRDKLAVLAAPALSAPRDESTVYTRTPPLAWTPVANATGYWIEIAADQAFGRMVSSKFGLDQPRFDPAALAPGEYFWRVAALDSFGLPGTRSVAWRFTIVIDTTPPFLTITAPERDAVLRDAAVRVAGETEPGARVTVQGQPVTVRADGRFEVTITAAVGANAIVVVAADPAGNETRRERTVELMPDRQSEVTFDASIPTLAPKHFLTAENVISLGGTTTPNAQVRIQTSAGAPRASATTDAAGRFRLNVPLQADRERFTIAVVTASGFTSTDAFEVTTDRSTPEIVLDEIPPRLTAVPLLALKGRTKPGARLTLNGREIANRNGRFEENFALAAGDNVIELAAADAAGNARIEKWSVKLDREPPNFLRSALTPVTSAGRSTLAIAVEAEDASGLARVAPFKIAAGNETFSGFLRFNRAAKRYEATLVIPEAAARAAILREVELQDDAGNKKLFEFK